MRVRVRVILSEIVRFSFMLPVVEMLGVKGLVTFVLPRVLLGVVLAGPVARTELKMYINERVLPYFALVTGHLAMQASLGKLVPHLFNSLHHIPSSRDSSSSSSNNSNSSSTSMVPPESRSN